MNRYGISLLQMNAEFLAKSSRQVSLVEQELLTLLEYLSSPRFFGGVPVVQSLVSCILFCRSLFDFTIVLSMFLVDFGFLIFPVASSNFPYKQVILALLQLKGRYQI